MKNLSDFTSQKQTVLFESTGAFFAFMDSQFEEKKVEGVAYVSMGAGLLCPKDNAKTLSEGLRKINDEGIKEDLRVNGVDKIIQRELANYECQIVGSYQDALDALRPYGITEDQVKAGYKVFWDHCVANDLF